MKLIEGALIKNTTKEERKILVERAFALGSIESLPPTDRLRELCQKYIDGEMEIHEIEEQRNKEMLASFKKENLA